MSISRRQFLLNLGMGTIWASLPSSDLFSSNILNKKVCNLSNLPLLHCDVIVVGAGPSGIPAAIAAAREGAKVILLEEDMLPGGAPVDMYVTYMCGAPRIGIYNDIIRKLNVKHSLSISPSSTLGDWLWDNKQHWWLPSSFAQVVFEMIHSEKNITLMCGSPVVDVLLKSDGNRNRVLGVCVNRQGMVQIIKAPITIDATGTGLVSAKAECDYFYGSDSRKDFNESIGLNKSDGKVQPCTMMYISQRTHSDSKFPINLFKTGVLDNDQFKWASQQTESEFRSIDTGIYLHWGKTIECSDTTDSVLVAEAQRQALERLDPQIKVLNKAGFVTHIAPKIGVRECRRIKGEYVITVDDIINGVMPDDKVADAWYSLDPWGMNIDEKIKQSVGPYGIPYRSLIPVHTEGLLTAGRIISGTRLAMSSYRVQPICATIGEAAGTAAAMVSLNKTEVRDIDIRLLQHKLEQKGLFSWYNHINMKVKMR
jgi:hypothetical protein